MQGDYWVINSLDSLAKFITYLKKLWEEHKYLRINIRVGRDRKLEQNRLLWRWNKIVNESKGWGSAEEAHRYFKLHIGVPMLMELSDEFAEHWRELIKNRYSYEEKLKFMEIIPVTRDLTVAEMATYLSKMQAAMALEGIILEGGEA